MKHLLMKRKSEWFILTKTFMRLVGVDYKFINQRGETGIARFYCAGLALFGIILVSIFSIYYAFEMMFKKWQAEVLISAFFSGLFVLIYILLIQTFSKSAFTSTKRIFTLSNIFRLGYVLFMGFIISKPIETYVFREQLDQEIVNYKQKLADDFSSKIHTLYNTQNTNDANKISLEETMASYRIEHSDFFIRRVQLLLAKYPSTWLICLLVITLFFLPGFLIFTISGDNTYYLSKKDYEQRLILAEYNSFKETYAQLFIKKYHLENIFFHENFLDPPFNTIRKPEQPYLSNEDFINKILYSK